MGSARGTVAMLACVVLAACGSVKPAAGNVARRPADPCSKLPAVSPLPSGSPAPVPDAGSGRVSLTIDGHQVPDEVVDVALSGAAQRATLDPRLFHASPGPRADLRTLQRGAVAGIVLQHMELCQAAADGFKPDRAQAEAGGREQVTAYEEALQRAAHPSPAGSPVLVPVPGSSPQRYAEVGPVSSSPMPPPAIPGGMSAQQYYTSEAFIQAEEVGQLRRREQERILQAAAGKPSWQALGEWMRRHLGEYSVKVEGLGSFSLPDAYEAAARFTASP